MYVEGRFFGVETSVEVDSRCMLAFDCGFRGVMTSRFWVVRWLGFRSRKGRGNQLLY